MDFSHKVNLFVSDPAWQPPARGGCNKEGRQFGRGCDGPNVPEGRIDPADRGIGPADHGIGPADRGIGPADRGIGPADRDIGPADRPIGPE